MLEPSKQSRIKFESSDSELDNSDMENAIKDFNSEAASVGESTPHADSPFTFIK